LQDQRIIVKKLNGMREETPRLASLYQRKLAALDELKKSLLHQAFSGQLWCWPCWWANHGRDRQQ
jgi:type I restriction enzyme, S subunit